MKEPPGSSETSVLTRATRRNNPEDTTLHSHRRENLKSYIFVAVVRRWKEKFPTEDGYKILSPKFCVLNKGKYNGPCPEL
jgi:hypothetical protein